MTKTEKKIRKAKKQNQIIWRYAVTVSFDYSNLKKGDIISRHKSYGAASRKARGSTMWGVVDALALEKTPTWA